MQGQNEYAQDVLNVPASLAGLPAISLAAGHGADSWPIGIQLAGQWGTDDSLLHISRALESLMLERIHSDASVML